MRQMQFSMPSEPGGAPMAGQPREVQVAVNSTPPPSFSGPMQAGPLGTGPDGAGRRPAAPARPVHIPGSMPVRGAVPAAAPIPVDVRSVGRNDPCPCGSGKKFKKCHGEGR